MQSVLITNDVQHNVIKFVSDLRQVSGFPLFPSNETDHHDIVEILLKVALNTIKQTSNKLVSEHKSFDLCKQYIILQN